MRTEENNLGAVVEVEISDIILSYTQRASRAKFFHYGINALIMVCFLLAVGFWNYPPLKDFFLIPGLSGQGALILSWQMEFQRRWQICRQAVEQLKHEKHLYLALQSPYDGPDSVQRSLLLIQNAENIISWSEQW